MLAATAEGVYTEAAGSKPKHVRHASLVASALAWMLNLWLHTEFIVKYWLVSRRIEQVLQQTED